MPQFLSPVCNDQMFDVNGDPLNGGQVETYIAGSATPAATYTSSAGTVQQANPILLNSLGKVSSPIWLAAGVTYKFVVKDSNGVTLWTLDGISGVNDAAVSVSEWVDSGFVPTYIGATSFSVPGDQTAILQVGRRLKTVNTSGLIYSGISASVFGFGVTTVTVLNDSGTLDAGLSSVAYGLISADNTSFPFATFAAANTVAVSNDDATNAAHYLLFADGTAGQENVKTGTAKLQYNPSSGELSAEKFKGAADSLTGSIPAAVVRGAMNASGAAPMFACRAFVNFDGRGTAGTNMTIRAGGNVASVYKTAAGDYLVTFTTAMPDTNYTLSGANGFASGPNYLCGVCTSANGTLFTKTTTQQQVKIISVNGDAVDLADVQLSFFR